MPAASWRNWSPMSLRSIPSASAARQSAAILMAAVFSGVGRSARANTGPALFLRRRSNGSGAAAHPGQLACS